MKKLLTKQYVGLYPTETGEKVTPKKCRACGAAFIIINEYKMDTCPICGAQSFTNAH